MKYFWELSTSEKYQISRQVLEALKRGDLIPQPCQFPGCNVAKIGVVAHHEDYDKPLEVVWLCRKHHRQRHSEINKEHKPKETGYDYPYRPHDLIEMDLSKYKKMKPWPKDYNGR